MLFKVNNHDYTSRVLSRTYKVNEADVYETWTDANGLTHRVVYRSRISGQFDMLFLDRNAYETFLDDLDAVKTDGYHAVDLYLNNKLQEVSANVFISMEPYMEAQYDSVPAFGKFTVKVTQR